MECTELKNKYEIIIKNFEELKLDVIAFTETKKKRQWIGNDWWIRSFL